MGYHVQIKICGITDVADLREAVRLGADAIGLNFHPPSPRYVPLEKAVALLRALPPFTEAVGVFVNKSVSELRAPLGQLGRIGTIQVHGGTPEIVDAFPHHFIPAFAVRDVADRDHIVRYLDSCWAVGRLPSAVLVDGYAAGLEGGTGQTAPWHLLADFAPGVPLLLAGGLTPENVATAIRAVRPWGVDVASGVEAAPGRKDAQRMRRFIEAARAAAAEL